MSELDKLAKIVAQRTPAKYWASCSKGQCCELWYRHFIEGPHCNREQAEHDVVFARAMGTCADELVAVVKAVDIFMDLFDPGPEDKCEEMDILRDSLAALKAKIAGIG